MIVHPDFDAAAGATATRPHTLAITGATGFLGRHLLAACVARGGSTIKVLTRDPASVGPGLPSVTVCRGDLTTGAGLTDLLEPGAVVLHLAYDAQDPKANVRAATHLVDAARAAEVARVVHCSTAVVVGFEGSAVVTEETPARPREGYQRAKLDVERLLQEGLPPRVELAILRPTEIIGPGGANLRVLIDRVAVGPAWRARVLRALLGARRLNCVSVHNVVAALLLLAETPVPQTGDVYQVSDDDDPDNGYDAAESLVRQYLGLSDPGASGIVPRSLLALLFRLMPDHSPPDRVYSSEKIRRLGYRPVATIRSTVREMVSSGARDAHP